MKSKSQVASRAITDIEYDDNTQILKITMQYGPPKHHGEVLQYGKVPRKTYDEFVKAESKGQYFNKFIRDNYPFLGKSG